ncbi:H101 protein, partial [Rhodinocichla rosea]|nr:H101 protein [Rhodinocichla rosea]
RMKARTMLDTTLAAPCSRAAPRKMKKVASGPKAREAAGPSVTKLVTRAVSTPKERKELSLATLRKALAVGGYKEEENKSHIKLGPKSLISNGTLVQTKGIGASGSFKLNKKPGDTKEKATKKRTAAKPKKPVAKKTTSLAKKPKKVAMVKKSHKKAKKPAATAAKKAAKNLKGATQAGHAKEAAKSPAKVKAVKPKAAKPKAVKPKVAKAKKAVPKKK